MSSRKRSRWQESESGSKRQRKGKQDVDESSDDDTDAHDTPESVYLGDRRANKEPDVLPIERWLVLHAHRRQRWRFFCHDEKSASMDDDEKVEKEEKDEENVARSSSLMKLDYCRSDSDGDVDKHFAKRCLTLSAELEEDDEAMNTWERVYKRTRDKHERKVERNRSKNAMKRSKTAVDSWYSTPSSSSSSKLTRRAHTVGDSNVFGTVVDDVVGFGYGSGSSREMIGLDQSPSSMIESKKAARESFKDDTKQFDPVRGSIFQIPDFARSNGRPVRAARLASVEYRGVKRGARTHGDLHAFFEPNGGADDIDIDDDARDGSAYSRAIGCKDADDEAYEPAKDEGDGGESTDESGGDAKPSARMERQQQRKKKNPQKQLAAAVRKRQRVSKVVTSSDSSSSGDAEETDSGSESEHKRQRVAIPARRTPGASTLALRHGGGDVKYGGLAAAQSINQLRATATANMCMLPNGWGQSAPTTSFHSPYVAPRMRQNVATSSSSYHVAGQSPSSSSSSLAAAEDDSAECPHCHKHFSVEQVVAHADRCRASKSKY
jgi:hypothetical protein